MSDPLVSTIIPAFNRANMLGEAVRSVVAQTYRPIEIIIVDDGSTDGTGEAAERMRVQYPEITQVLHIVNSGPGLARQAGLEASVGDFVQYLDSDDLLLPRKFELQVRGLQHDTEAGISYGLTTAMDTSTGETQVTHGTDLDHRQIFPEVLRARIWHTVTPLYRRSVCEAIGAWSGRRILEDWEYDCRAGVLGVKLHYTPELIAAVRHHDGERAGFAWKSNRSAMLDRATAYLDILDHALAAGISDDRPEMQHFVRSLFWMARVAGSNGLATEARDLFEAARRHAIDPGWDYRLYSLLAATFGWARAGRVATVLRGSWR